MPSVEVERAAAREIRLVAAVSMSTQAIDREPDASSSAPRGLRLKTSEPRHGEIQPFDKGLDEAHRVLRANIVVQRFR